MKSGARCYICNVVSVKMCFNLRRSTIFVHKGTPTYQNCKINAQLVASHCWQSLSVLQKHTDVELQHYNSDQETLHTHTGVFT